MTSMGPASRNGQFIGQMVRSRCMQYCIKLQFLNFDGPIIVINVYKNCSFSDKLIVT